MTDRQFPTSMEPFILPEAATTASMVHAERPAPRPDWARRSLAALGLRATARTCQEGVVRVHRAMGSRRHVIVLRATVSRAPPCRRPRYDSRRPAPSAGRSASASLSTTGLRATSTPSPSARARCPRGKSTVNRVSAASTSAHPLPASTASGGSTPASPLRADSATEPCPCG